MNQNEMNELEDLALTDGQQTDIKGGPVEVEWAIMIASPETNQLQTSSGFSSSGVGILKSSDGGATWTL